MATPSDSPVGSPTPQYPLSNTQTAELWRLVQDFANVRCAAQVTQRWADVDEAAAGLAKRLQAMLGTTCSDPRHHVDHTLPSTADDEEEWL